MRDWGRCFKVTLHTGAEKFLIVSMEGRAKGLSCADLGARTPIGASGKADEALSDHFFKFKYIFYEVYFHSFKYIWGLA